MTGSSDSVLNQGSTYGYDEFNRLASRTVNAGTVQNYTYVYDRYGNRWQQNPQQGGSSSQLSFNPSNNQVIGNTYDAAGNMTNDGFHSYTYDAEGHITAVDGGQTATYIYNALNQRVSATVGGATTEYAFNAAGQRVSEWNGTTHAQLKGKYYWGGKPVAYYANGSTHFEHQDWLGTERMRTTYNGAVEGTFTSLPFGDGQAVSGADGDANHYAQLDHDTETATDHAQFRQYSNTQGRWLSPDPYSGSYQLQKPQSFNRYAYVGNNPLADVDPSGQMMCRNLNLDGSCQANWDNGSLSAVSGYSYDGAGIPADIAQMLLQEGWGVECPNDVCSGFSSSGQYGQFYAFEGGTQGYYNPGDLSHGINEVYGHLLTNDQYNTYVQVAYSYPIDVQRRALAHAIANASRGQISYDEAYNSLQVNGGFIDGCNYNFKTTYGPNHINCTMTRCVDGIHFAHPGFVHLDTSNPYGGVGDLFEHFLADVFLGHVYYTVIPRPWP